MPAPPLHRGIFAVDIEGSGQHHAPTLAAFRDWLRTTLRQALAGTIPDARFAGDLGDGVLVTVSPDSIVALLDTVIPRLATELRHRNRGASAAAQLRVRAVVHRGYVLADEGTVIGRDVTFAFRLLDADILRACLRATAKPLAVIVSYQVYTELIAPDYGAVDPADFTAVRVPTKESWPPGGVPARAWAWVPEDRQAVERALEGRPPPGLLPARPARWAQRRDRLKAAAHRLAGRAVAWVRGLPPRTRLLLAGLLAVALIGTPVALALTGDEPLGCPPAFELRIATSGSKKALLDELTPGFEEWARDAGGCSAVNLTPYAISSTADVVSALAGGWPESRLDESGPEPDLWWPDSSAEVGRLRKTMADAGRHPVELAELGSIMSSPVVLAVTEPLAAELGWPDEQPALDDILRRARRPAGAGGELRLGRTSPLFSSAGLHATVALYASTLGADPLDAAAFDGDQAAALHQTELAITPAGGEDVAALLCDLVGTGAAAGVPPLNAALVPEQAVIAFNRGNLPGSPCELREGRPRLRAFYPAGLPPLDHPLVEVTRAAWLPPTRAPAVHGAAARLRDYLLQDPAARRLLDARYRTPGGELSRAADPEGEGIDHNQPATRTELPGQDTVQALLREWGQARRIARVLLAMDVSESMRLDNRLGDAVQAALHAADLFSGNDQVGLWRFARRIGPGGLDYEEEIPLGPVREPVGSSPRVDALRASLGALEATGSGTGLYDVVDDGVRHLRDGHDQDTNSALVVLTDAGQNNDDVSISREALLSTLEGRPAVRVFVIAIGAGNCDRFGLAELAATSGGECLDTGGVTVDLAFQRIAAVLLGSGT